jgi:hypothetical protein
MRPGSSFDGTQPKASKARAWRRRGVSGMSMAVTRPAHCTSVRPMRLNGRQMAPPEAWLLFTVARRQEEALEESAGSRRIRTYDLRIKRHAESTWKWMAGTDARGELYPYTFSADARYEIEELLSEVIDLMRSSEVLPLHLEKRLPRRRLACGSRGRARDLARQAGALPAWPCRCKPIWWS